MGLPVIISEMQKEHWDWLKRRANPVLCEDTQGLVAFRGYKIVAAAAFDSWSHSACQAHIAIEDPFVLRWRFLECICDYAFNFGKRQVMVGMTPADNEKALAFNRKVGMREVYRIKNGYKFGIDYVLQEMHKDDCRWLKNEVYTDGWQKRTRHAQYG